MDESWISFCHGYVQAVADGPHFDENGHCIPLGTTRADLVGQVVQILQANEGLHGLGAYSVVYAAFATAYPCNTD
ncbi:Rap1a/Tai family immunity protein [Oceaniradius stylonematis]|uniref:Rap1a/Tai family immunity protein n=1 Tax=Oceaniradius stylonematis TaxID=2184161 RepID=UPI003C7EC808